MVSTAPSSAEKEALTAGIVEQVDWGLALEIASPPVEPRNDPFGGPCVAQNRDEFGDERQAMGRLPRLGAPTSDRPWVDVQK